MRLRPIVYRVSFLIGFALAIALTPRVETESSKKEVTVQPTTKHVGNYYA